MIINWSSGTDIFNALYFGVILFEKIAKHYKLKEKDYAFCLELENAGEVVPVFEGEKFKEYIKNTEFLMRIKKSTKARLYSYTIIQNALLNNYQAL